MTGALITRREKKKERENGKTNEAAEVEKKARITN